MPQRPDATGSGGADSNFEQFLEFVPDAIVGVDRMGEIVLVNAQAEELFGFGRDELIGKSPQMLIPERFRRAHNRHLREYFSEPRTRPMGIGPNLFALRQDGTELQVEISLAPIEVGGEKIAVAAIRDVSQRTESERERAREEKLQQTRRLESVGQLAGGIAHDFNNALGVIMNYAEFVAEEVDADSPTRRDVEEIRRAAERAAALTRRLLVFGQLGADSPREMDLAALVRERENLLRQTLGTGIELEISLDPELWRIEADPTQVEQVLVNLTANARDAMPDGGKLLVEAENTELDEEYAFMHPDTTPGRYVRLKLSDTGVGMDRETAERAFEPFFTTKDECTGLGLPAVYGIAAKAGGRVDLYSEPMIGTTVKVHLPVAATVAPTTPPAVGEGGGRVVLVVDDEPNVRRMAERILTKGGYTVIGTDRGSEALDVCRRKEQTIDLLLTDVIMPELLGTELVEQARAVRPSLRALYMSGYSHGVLAPQSLTSNGSSAFIEKPFNARALLGVVQELLERPARATR